jgi:hypothetical protein
MALAALLLAQRVYVRVQRPTLRNRGRKAAYNEAADCTFLRRWNVDSRGFGMA